MYVYTKNIYIIESKHKYKYTYACFFSSKMFKLNQKYEVDQKILISVYIRCSPSEISTISTAHSQMYIIMARDDSVNSVSNSYLDLNLI